MTKDDLKKHGVTAGIAATVAVVAAFAVRPHSPVTSLNEHAEVQTGHRSNAQVAPKQAREACQLAEGNYASLGAVKAKADRCSLQVITERPYAMIECGDKQSGVEVRATPTPNERRVVDCALAKPN